MVVRRSRSLSVIRFALGVIDYLGDDTGLRGCERWMLSVHEDGTRTLRAHSEMWDTSLQRDVVHTVTSSFRPLRTFITQRLGGAFLGEGWFHFRPEELVSAGDLNGFGSLDQRCPLVSEPQFFVPHAVCCDAWIVPAYDLGMGGEQHLTDGWRSSPTANGSTGPCAERMPPIGVSLLGEERVTVPAGTFDTLHFAIEQPGGVRDELWTTAEDYLLIQLRSDILNSWYHLVTLETGSGSALASR